MKILFPQIPQIHPIIFQKSAQICEKNLRNLREKYLHLFCPVLRKNVLLQLSQFKNT
jgi:hypothetical protein